MRRFPFSQVLFGGVFVLAGSAVVLFFGEVATLTCDRIEMTQVACELTSKRLFKERVTSIPMGHLQGAEVDVNRDSDGDTYRVVLVTQNGRIPFTNAYSSRAKGKREKVNQIDAFINHSEQKSLTIRQDDRWSAYLFGGLFALSGGGVMIRSIVRK